MIGNLKKTLSAGAVVLCLGFSAQAELIVRYDAGDNTNALADSTTPTADPSFQAEHVQGGAMGVSPAQQLIFISPPTFSMPVATPDNGFAATNWNVGGTTRYFEFAVTLLDGYSLNLETFNFDERSFANRPSAFGLRYSGDGFAANIGTGINDTGWDPISFDISTNTVAVSGSVTFRIFAQNAPNENATWHIDNIELNGTLVAPIPEPATGGMALAGLASAFYYLLRRNRLKQRK